MTSRVLGPVAGALLLAAGVGASVLVHNRASKTIEESSGWHGKVERVARSGPGESGGLMILGAGTPARVNEGAALPPHARIRTDASTRARIALEDGCSVVLDRSSEVVLSPGPRSLELVAGQLAFEVESVQGAPDVRLKVPEGDVSFRDGKFVVTKTPDATVLDAERGTASIVASAGRSDVRAGEEAILRRDSVDVTPSGDVAGRLAFSERLEETTPEGVAPGASRTGPGMAGLGELVARRPGKKDEKDRALHLATHAATIRISSSVARTTVEEVFSNDTGDDLEGIYRFPLPAGAKIEKLALDVDGKLVPGSFVEKAKAAAIWRGAIQNAAPKEQKPQEEIVWVPGPWHDPALLEWQGGDRFELKIFPIPRHGSRRVQIAYTETVSKVSGVRHYVYPLPENAPAIDRFSVDVQVRGADASRGVRAGGYGLESRPVAAGVALGKDAEHLTPSGDLTLDYALASDKDADVTAWAYRDPEVGQGDGDPFVALAMRPKLPRWGHEAFRDDVLVVDSGRSMTGERFKRAGQLAARIAREMDRRDRVTVLACDVTCRRMPGGWLTPGSTSAEAVLAFLTDLVPEGASDLVSAVRAAGATPDRRPENDLRVLLLSSGTASAGYSRTEKLAAEVAASLPDERAEVVSVPIGGDADQTTLGEIARGGGGVVVPYVASQSDLETAVAVLSAAYGATLREVTLELPDGLYASAPSALAPIRAGAEAWVGLRMRGDRVQGEAVLKGKVAGQPFEARYPLDVRASNEPGNAFVPRLYASERIADVERSTDDSARPELVKLSQRYAVPSRYTSLLVLESEAMFKAFGIDRAQASSAFTGENEAVASFATTPGKPASSKSGGSMDLGDEFGAAGLLDDKPAGGGFGGGGGGHGAWNAHAAADAAPAEAPVASATVAPPPPPAPARVARAAPRLLQQAMRPQAGQWMRREWFRSAGIANFTPPVSDEKVAAARAAVAAAPDERGKHRELARLLSLDGLVGPLEDEVRAWSAKDPLDIDGIAAQADVLARRGKRDEALRVLSGVVASAGAQGRLGLERALATAYARAGKAEACAFWIASGELAPSDVDSVAHAAGCERAQGHSSSAERWMASLTTDASRAKALPLAVKYEGLVRSREALPERASWGDLVVDASWDEAADLDVVVIDPAGNRQSWSSRSTQVRVEDPRSMHHELLGLGAAAAGTFMVEVVRTDGGESSAPVHGTVRIRCLGRTTTKTFDLSGPVADVARVDVRWESRLVPVENVPVF
jgi:Vault protein inter-alpha-trypsin domain/von Willebrand factor type A domain/FecR protein